MQKRVASALFAGLVSGALMDFPGAGVFFGAVAPYLPLLLLGLSEGAQLALHAGMVGIIVAMLIGGTQAGFNMVVFVVLPCSVILHALLRYRVDEQGRKEWYPALRAVAHLSLLSAGVYMALALMASSSYSDGMQTVLKKSLSMDYSQLEPPVAEIMQKLAHEWSFLIFAFAAWLWIFLTWGVTVLSQHLLAKQGRALRPTVALRPLGVPHGVLALLFLCGGLVAFGNSNDSYNAKVVMLILFLPYFLSGMAYIHALSFQWRPRALWLFLIYIILVFIQWSLFLPVMAGLYFHVTEMLDKPKKIG